MSSLNPSSQNPGSLRVSSALPFPKSNDMVVDDRPIELRPLDSAPAHKLNQLQATAICGNDITSSCLYVAALSAIYAGKYAPWRC